jgi:hypothetical protein
MNSKPKENQDKKVEKQKAEELVCFQNLKESFSPADSILLIIFSLEFQKSFLKLPKKTSDSNSSDFYHISLWLQNYDNLLHFISEHCFYFFDWLKSFYFRQKKINF